MIRCPELRCGLFFPDERRLISHLVTDHLVSPTTAGVEASKAALNVRIDAAIVRSAQDGAKRYPPPKETPMATNRKTADPSACQLCARLTEKYDKPMKCKRHGGPGLSTSNGGGGPKKDQAPKPAKVKKAAGLDAKATSMLTEAKAQVTKLRAALALEELRVQIYSDLVGA